MISNVSTPSISIIVPVYQVARYLKTCLDSIIEQSFTDWEMILVDDGSTDGGDKICDEYSEQDTRIHVYHQENQGVSVARNKGLEHAKGEYIAMIDPDDILLSRDYLYLLYDAAVKNKAEISICNIYRIYENDKPPLFNSKSVPVDVVSGKEIFSKPIVNVSLFCIGYAKLYHRDCFRGVRYPKGRVLEDIYVFPHLVYPSNRIALLDLTLYGRRVRKGSIMTSTSAAVLFRDATVAFENCVDYFLEHHDDTACTWATQSCIDHQFYFYLKSLLDGSVSIIQNEYGLDLEFFERRYSYAHILNRLQKNSIDNAFPQISTYKSLIAKDTTRLLMSSLDLVLNRLQRHNLATDRVRQLEIMSQYEDVSVLFHGVLAQTSTNQNEKDNRHFKYVREAARQKIISMNHLKKVRQAFEDKGLRWIPFIPEDLSMLFSRPWFNGEQSQLFWIKKEDLSTLRSIMKELSFDEIEVDPLEYERNTEWSFENPDVEMHLTFITKMPFCFYGCHKSYIDSLCEALLSEQRAMSLVEYASVLTAKLYSDNHIYASAKLRDLLDLCLIIKNDSHLTTDTSFQKAMAEMSLDDIWMDLFTLCQKLIENTDVNSLTQKEFDFIFGIVSGTYYRLSFLKRESAALLTEGKLLDPVKYAVVDDKGIAYLVNSKAACSSIVASLIGETVPCQESGITGQDIFADDFVHRTAEMRGIFRNEIGENRAPVFSFTFVRNPFSRLVSCYKNKYNMFAEDYISDFHFDLYLRGYMMRDEGFSTFVKKVCALPYRLMNRHFNRQSDFIFDENGNCRCDYVGHFENLKEGYLTIQKQFSLSALPHLNKTVEQSWMDYYTCETAEIVYQTFKKDFISFEYEDSYTELMSYLKKKSRSKSNSNKQKLD